MRDELAAAVGIAPDVLVGLAGGAWEQVSLGATLSDESTAALATLWFVSGDPIQVLIGVDVITRHVHCHVPVIEWESQTPVLGAGECTGKGAAEDGLDWLTGAIARAAAKRRRTFRWCSMCRTLTAPENGGDPCHSCMQTYNGVVF